MSNIRDIPDVKDASGIFKFDGAKKAIIVPLTFTVDRFAKVTFTVDRFAKINNLPVHDWDADYEETYGDAENSSED